MKTTFGLPADASARAGSPTMASAKTPAAKYRAARRNVRGAGPGFVPPTVSTSENGEVSMGVRTRAGSGAIRLSNQTNGPTPEDSAVGRCSEPIAQRQTRTEGVRHRSEATV